MTRTEIIGDATLYLADCRDVLFDAPEFHCVVSDPPYGIDYRSGHATDDLWRSERFIRGDETTEVRDWVIEFVDGAAMLLFGSWKRPRPAQTKMVLIWDKGGALGMGDLSLPWKPDHEEIYVLGNGFVGARDSGSVIRCPPVQSMASNGRVHPNQKPVELLQRLIVKTQGVICDPFMGSGSTGVAAMKQGRKFIGVEVVPEYFEIACQRIAAAYAQPRLFADEPPPLLPDKHRKETT